MQSPFRKQINSVFDNGFIIFLPRQSMTAVWQHCKWYSAHLTFCAAQSRVTLAFWRRLWLLSMLGAPLCPIDIYIIYIYILVTWTPMIFGLCYEVHWKGIWNCQTIMTCLCEVGSAVASTLDCLIFAFRLNFLSVFLFIFCSFSLFLRALSWFCFCCLWLIFSNHSFPWCSYLFHAAYCLVMSYFI